MEEKFGKELTLRETQLAALEVLKVVDGICSEEGLRYYLAYGTLIGAVRHQGFIPWDDDLDIVMPRPDYERLLAYFAAHADELRPMVAINRQTNNRTPFLITRISDVRYRMFGECGLDVDEMGAFIDVYPLDGLGDDLDGAKALVRKCGNLMRRFAQAGGFRVNDLKVGSLKKALKAARRFFMHRPDHYADEQAKLLSAYSFEGSAYCGVAVWPTYPSVFKADCFEDEVRVPFEAAWLPIPSGYDELLTITYGDYMTLPPEDKRFGHHDYALMERA